MVERERKGPVSYLVQEDDPDLDGPPPQPCPEAAGPHPQPPLVYGPLAPAPGPDSIARPRLYSNLPSQESLLTPPLSPPDDINEGNVTA
ncbi:hypothetical protein KOW79_001191 [Hemibagrus wyckioides]|uniref:Uncharacterized protein n=1 Tax=Hemibagrus wyckioides TaxID=337641 RepID=A0A9D3STM4_9TELE|nr:hypothetical protein KOW79_001191 [Hemibagrus wyckioides]